MTFLSCSFSDVDIGVRSIMDVTCSGIVWASVGLLGSLIGVTLSAGKAKPRSVPLSSTIVESVGLITVAMTNLDLTGCDKVCPIIKPVRLVMSCRGDTTTLDVIRLLPCRGFISTVVSERGAIVMLFTMVSRLARFSLLLVNIYSRPFSLSWPNS